MADIYGRFRVYADLLSPVMTILDVYISRVLVFFGGTCDHPFAPYLIFFLIVVHNYVTRENLFSVLLLDTHTPSSKDQPTIFQSDHT